MLCREGHAKRIAALKNADNLVKDILYAADINQDGKISYDGPLTHHAAPKLRRELTLSCRVLQVLSRDRERALDAVHIDR